MRLFAFLFIALLIISSPLLAQLDSQEIFYGNGKIGYAKISDAGLIIGYETKAHLADIRGEGWTQAFGILPSCALNQRFAFSDNGDFVLRMTYEGNGDYVTVSKAELFDLHGNLITTIERPGFSEALVSNSGEIVGIDRNINISYKSQLLFFDGNGALINTVEFPAVTQVKFSADGQGVGAVSGNRGLVIFDLRGNEMAEIGDCQWFEFVIQSGGVICAYTNNNRIGFHNSTEQKINWIDEFGDEVFRDIALYSDDSGTGIIAVSRYNLYLIDAVTGEILLERHTESPESFTSCAISHTAEHSIQVAWGWETDRGRDIPFEIRHTEGGYSIATWDKAGSAFKIESEPLSYSKWNVFTPSVSFLDQGNLIIQTMDEVRILKLAEGRN